MKIHFFAAEILSPRYEGSGISVHKV